MGKDKKRHSFSTEESLCDLRKQIQEHLEEYKQLVRDPAYVCRKCGRAARNADNLCRPEPL